MASGDFPVPKFHFLVEIEGTEIPFQEVSGLEETVEHLEYRNGNSPIFITQKRLGMRKSSSIVCKKGIFSGDAAILDIFKKLTDKAYYSNGDPIADVAISLLDENAGMVHKWVAINCVPTKISGTDFKSDDNSVAVESIEFQHEGFFDSPPETA